MKKLLLLLSVFSFQFSAFSQVASVTVDANGNVLNGKVTNFPTGKLTVNGVATEPAITPGTTSQFWRGDKTWQSPPSSMAYSVKDYGAVADLKTVNDGAITSGQATLTSSAAVFTSADVTSPQKAIIVRAAGAAGADLVTTIVSVSGGVATLAATAGTTVSGARVDYGTDNVAAFNAAGAAVPAAGGLVYIPGGGYFLGASSGTHIWRYSRGNIGVRGDGIGQTVINYSSKRASTGVGPGNGLTIGDGATHVSNCTITDFTIRDVNNSASTGGGHNPAGIETFFVSNLRIARVEVIDAKGNSAINISGSLSSNLPTESGAYIQDNYIHPETSFNEGDGINLGDYRYVLVTGNRIKAVGRHGYEGGGQCYSQLIAGNFIDMNNAGGDGINPTGGNQTEVTDNEVINVSGSQTPIDFTTDLSGAFTLQNISVHDNRLNGGTWSTKFQNTGGSGTGAIDNIRVQNNQMTGSQYAVGLGQNDLPNIMIRGNRFTSTNNGTAIISVIGTIFAIPTGRIIEMRDNISNVRPIGLIGHPWGSQRELRVEHNVIGSTMADAATGSYGGYGQANFGGGGTLAPGAALVQTVSYYGAIPGDKLDVIFADPAQWSSSFTATGKVSAQDTVELRIYNHTTATLTYPGSPYYVYFIAHRQ